LEASSRLGEVGAEVRAVIEQAGLPAAFADAIAESLTLGGSIFAAEPLAHWSRLLLAAAEAAGLADWHQAVPAAAAVELTIASFEIFDDIQDGDPNAAVAKLGLPQTLNVAIGLLVLGQRALLRLPSRGVEPEVALAVQRELTDAIAAAGSGQYLDLALQGSPSTTEQDALDVAERKTATLVAGACRVGGRLGTDDPRVLDVLARFGLHVGLADQLQNDLDALQTSTWRDRRHGEATLPAAAARAFSLGDVSEAEADPARQRALADLGALHYTWVVMDLHRQQAREILEELGPANRTEALLELL
jgi:geranylgeranyl pyrophosphate synthase